ncbi:MAG TPA: CBS domain-containing protein [Devosia sp.]|nr:CBS domain-containing protein [Devosia sp.]
MRIDNILPVIATRLATISRDAQFVDAARLFGAGAYRMLVVCGPAGEAVGIVTRTDAMRHVGRHPDPLTATVAEVMIPSFTCARLSDDLLATWHVMAAARLNHVPVLSEAGKPLGTLTADDALKALLDAEDYEERLLRDYIAGLGYR